jgi:uncharacterized phage protein gp47/JayE
MSRTVDQILDDIKFQFKDTVLENAATNKGNLYSLIRGMAVTCFTQEQLIERVINNRVITATSGVQLDTYASTYNLIRRGGTSAFGNIIIKSDVIIDIPANTILQTPDGLLVYETTQSIRLGVNREVTVSIVSITKSFQANLTSQSILISPQYNRNLTIQVGSFRDNNNNIVGSLNGGSSQESDESFRARIISYTTNKGLVTLGSIKALAQNYVSDIYFVEGRPAAGYTTMYINSTDQLTIDLLSQKINEIKPVGTLILIKTIQYQQVDIVVDIRVTSTNSDSISIINTNVKESINRFFSNLTIGQTLIVNELSSFITSFTGYPNVINKPIKEIIPLIPEYLLLPNEVTINVKSK